jgi:hypothetical protein
VQSEIQECNTRATERRRRRRNKRTLLLEKCGVPPRVLELEDSTLMLVETQLHPERLLIAQYVKYTAKDIKFFTNNNIKSNNNNNCRSLQQVSSPGSLVINPLLPQRNIVACVRAPTSSIMQRRKRSKVSAETREESSRYYGLVRDRMRRPSLLLIKHEGQYLDYKVYDRFFKKISSMIMSEKGASESEKNYSVNVVADRREEGKKGLIYLLTQARVLRVRGANRFKMPQRSSSSNTLKTPNPCGLRSFLACILSLSLSIQSRTNPHKHAMLMRERSQGRAIDCRTEDQIPIPVLLAMMTTLDVRFSLSCNCVLRFVCVSHALSFSLFF